MTVLPSFQRQLHRESKKLTDAIILSATSPNCNQCSEFFCRGTEWWIRTKLIAELITPEMCSYTTLWFITNNNAYSNVITGKHHARNLTVCNVGVSQRHRSWGYTCKPTNLYAAVYLTQECSQRTNWTELNWPATCWPSYTTRYWSHASASRSWLAAGAAFRELEFSSVQFICCEHAFTSV